MSDEERLAVARNYALLQFDFYVHIAVFVLVNSVLFITALLTSPNMFWFAWPAMGWGIALLLHAASVLLLSPKKNDMIDFLARRDLDTQPGEHHQS